jgi:TolB-like protein
LLVMPLTVEEPTPESGRLRQELADMIRSQLGRTPGVRVVPGHRLAAALADAGYTEESVPSAESVSGLARRLRAERLVTGCLVRVGDQFVLTAQVIDVATGRTEGAAAVRGRHPADLSNAVADLCRRLPGALPWNHDQQRSH